MNGNWYTKGPIRAYARCLNCFPILNEYLHSRRELELAKYIEEIVPHNVIYGEDDTLRNIIKPYVIDIYIPEEKVAIEFNGLRWHNIDQHETGYHLNKTKMCENKGIKLIHVWEDEWDFKKEEVKKNLRNILNNYYKFDKPVIKLDRSLYCKLCIPSNYIIINEIEPEVILRTNENSISYKVENCGYLLCKK